MFLQFHSIMCIRDLERSFNFQRNEDTVYWFWIICSSMAYSRVEYVRYRNSFRSFLCYEGSQHTNSNLVQHSTEKSNRTCELLACLSE